MIIVFGLVIIGIIEITLIIRAIRYYARFRHWDR